MIKLLIIGALMLAGFAWAAETTPTPDDNTRWKETKPAPEDAPAKTGYEKTENGLFPKTASYDGKWTVKGFSIVDAQGKVAFTWENKVRALARKYIMVSWSQDSQRVIMWISSDEGKCSMPPSYLTVFGKMSKQVQSI
jgi:hypothetical protein